MYVLDRGRSYRQHSGRVCIMKNILLISKMKLPNSETNLSSNNDNFIKLQMFGYNAYTRTFQL